MPFNTESSMQAMTRTGALNHSARVFSWIKNQRCYRARNDIYNLMIWLYARHYRVDAARALWKEMQEWRLVFPELLFAVILFGEDFDVPLQ
jgi:pentatricopeptide repeat protein